MSDVQQVKKLRAETGISIAECRQALAESRGDFAAALNFLRAAGAALAAKKSGRALAAGILGVYIHTNGLVGAMVALVCETDFVAKNRDFKTLADDLAMHVTAFEPPTLEELLAQPFVRDPNLTVKDVVTAAVQKFGENVAVARFARLAVDAD